jgi:gamma-glutamylcyclotransferase (GGCT)/AIG2-like uncharacterized protein YtfP
MLYAAYGSNMNLEQMAFRCPYSVVVGKGMINNYKLKFSYHADIVPSKGDCVPVVLWEVPDIDFIALDRYEGVAGGYYKRVNLPVETSKGKKNAIVYVMCGYNEFQMPSNRYYEIIKTGYEDNKISRRYLYNAIIECARELGIYEDYEDN